ncbi:MAG: site-specific DNA-methyltransferase [Planctomycetes bacterium]|nr:site-specific DNA-methyltransferase [Planctomycetota bacterium]
MREALRVAKPGAHALVWALPRTSHWTGTALERAGWEIRDQLHHVFGSGFPKSLDVSKAIDAAAGVKREVVGLPNCRKRSDNGECRCGTNTIFGQTVHAPATAPATAWSGWGTALKPAHEVWWLARKPLAGTVAGNVLEHGTGALNIEGCRIRFASEDDKAAAAAAAQRAGQTPRGAGIGTFERRPEDGEASASRYIAGLNAGRWPPNLLLSHDPRCNGVCVSGCPVAEMDRQSGDVGGGFGTRGDEPLDGRTSYAMPGQGQIVGLGDAGGASRFFPVFRYVAKPTRGERDAGCWDLEAVSGNDITGREAGSAGAECSARAGTTSAARRNIHPTVKPVELMEWLARLVTPPGGTVLDLFAGSGSTGCAAVRLGFGFIGIEREPDYVRIAERRIRLAANAPKSKPLGALERGDEAAPGQLGLFPR